MKTNWINVKAEVAGFKSGDKVVTTVPIVISKMNTRARIAPGTEGVVADFESSMSEYAGRIPVQFSTTAMVIPGHPREMPEDVDVTPGLTVYIDPQYLKPV